MTTKWAQVPLFSFVLAIPVASMAMQPPPPSGGGGDSGVRPVENTSPVSPSGTPNAPSGASNAAAATDTGSDWGNAGSASPEFMGSTTRGSVDKVYGPTGRGNVTLDGYGDEVGLTILPPEVYSEDETIGPQLPEFHQVIDGDSLWAISAKYFQDPYLWPKLWAQNPQVTNANWVFPGDKIRLRDPVEQVAPADPVAALEQKLRVTSERRATPALPPEYLINRFVFVEAAEVDTSMEIIGANQPKVMLANLDLAYVSYGRNEPPVLGERLSVYQVARPIHDASVRRDGSIKRGRKLGYLVEVVGEAEFRRIAPKSAEARIVSAVSPIERGMRVGTLRSRYLRVSPKTATEAVRGTIIDSLVPSGIYGQETFVVTNLGQGDGIGRGQVLDVVRRGDELLETSRLSSPNEPGHPSRVVGTLLVVESQEHLSIALVVRSALELSIGDHIEARVQQDEEAMTADASPAGAGR